MDRRNARSEFAATILFFLLTLLLVLGAASQCVNDSMFRAMIGLAQQSELLASRYFGEVAPEKVFADAWRGMQGAIPFRVELSADSEAPLKVGRPRNWGITLTPRDSLVVVEDVAENSPFFGFLLPQDRITGVDTLRESVIDFIDYLNTHPKGATRIFFEREGRTDSVTVQITAIEPVDGALVEVTDSVGYLALKLPSKSDFDAMFETLRSSGAQGFIIDLRDSRGNDYRQAERISNQIKKILNGKPAVVLMDGSSKGATEEIARALSGIAEVVTMGTATAGMPAIVDEIDLRSGRRLYVSVNERLTRDFEELADTGADSSHADATSTAVVPAINCRKGLMSPLAFELIHGGYLTDFVTTMDFAAFPNLADEDTLLRRFEDYLQQRRFRYDPLGRALSDMSLNDMDEEMSPIYQRMRETHRGLGDLDLDEYRDEVIRTLLKTIHRVKIGGESTLAIRARTDDPCLAEALSYLKGRSQ